jgi:diacylglycerol kinase family enzyme
LKLPKDPVDVLATVTGGERLVIDTAVCNDQTFTVMAGTGFDAAMVDDADATKERLGVAAYVRAAVVNARQGDPVRTTVTVDGATFFEGEASCVLVGNLGTLKAGLTAFPAASPTDGILDVAVLTATGMRDWAGVLWKVVRRQQEQSGHAHLTRGKEIAVELDDERRMQLDGGAKGTTDALKIAVRPASLRVCVPEG